REMITPGQTAFTRISGANALAIDFVIVIRPPFDAAYAIELPDPAMPATDATLTIEPPPPVRISGIAARDTKNGPFKFTAKIRSHLSSVISSSSVCFTKYVVPALFTTTSSRPNSTLQRSIIARTWPSSATSQATQIARTPFSQASAAVASASSFDREKLMATSKPRAASCSVVAFPTPVPPPVMNAAFFEAATNAPHEELLIYPLVDTKIILGQRGKKAIERIARQPDANAERIDCHPPKPILLCNGPHDVGRIG